MTTFGWVFASAGTAVFAADFFAAFGQLVSDTYKPTPWQIFLLTVAALTVAFILNTLLIKTVPHLPFFMVVFLNIVALFIYITLLAVVHPKASSKTAFIDVVNTTGWSSDGLVFFLGLLPGMMTVCLFDTAAHMAEELPHPELQVPIVMLANAVLSCTGGLIMVICLILCTTHPENLVRPLAGMPIFQICWDAWSSKAFVIVVCLIYWAMTLNASISIITGCSRVIWSFAKVGGLPFKDLLSEVNGRFQTPLNAVLASCMACAVFSLLCFAPLSVLNGLFGASVVCFTTSYAMPICLVLANRRNLPPNRYLNIGATGPVVNFVAICWMAIGALFVCFPQPVMLGYYELDTSDLWLGSVYFVGELVQSEGNLLFAPRSSSWSVGVKF
jgi:amino acid transporter